MADQFLDLPPRESQFLRIAIDVVTKRAEIVSGTAAYHADVTTYAYQIDQRAMTPPLAEEELLEQLMNVIAKRLQDVRGGR